MPLPPQRLALLLLAVPIGLLLLGAALSVPDFPALALAKLREGGLWTGLVAFLALALVLGVRNAGKPPGSEPPD